MTSRCIICDEEFKSGDRLQGFFGLSPDPEPFWNKPVRVDEEFQSRVAVNGDNLQRKHENCKEKMKCN